MLSLKQKLSLGLMCAWGRVVIELALMIKELDMGEGMGMISGVTELKEVDMGEGMGAGEQTPHPCIETIVYPTIPRTVNVSLTVHSGVADSTHSTFKNEKKYGQPSSPNGTLGHVTLPR